MPHYKLLLYVSRRLVSISGLLLILYIWRMMIRTVSILLFLSMSSTTSWCQSWSDGSEEAKFVQIYMQSKLLRNNGEEVIQRLLSDHQVSADRYKQLVQSAAVGTKLQLTVREEALIIAIAEQEEKLREQKAAATDSLCQSYEMSSVTYDQILHKYRNNLQYQRRLHPYFQAYVKSVK